MKPLYSNKRGMVGKAVDLLFNLTLTIGILGICLVVATVLIQVFARYIAGFQTAWAPEFAQLTFVWTALFAVALGVKSGKHMSLDVFPQNKPAWVEIVLSTVSHLAIITVSLTLVIYGAQSLSVSFSRNFPALGIPTGWMHLAIPAAFSICTIFAIDSLYRSIFRALSNSKAKVSGSDSHLEMEVNR